MSWMQAEHAAIGISTLSLVVSLLAHRKRPKLATKPIPIEEQKKASAPQIAASEPVNPKKNEVIWR